MQPKSFDQWKKDNADMLAELEANPDDCTSCDGTGNCQCDCGDQHDCAICDGTGKVNRDAAKKLYEKYLYDDKDKLERWAKEPISGARQKPSPYPNFISADTLKENAPH